MKDVLVKVAGAQSKALSHQCVSCDYFEFEQDSSRKVLDELRNTPLKIKQRIVKLSQDRLGMYFNKHIVESLNLEKGSEISVSVPDKRHIIIELD